MTSTLTLSCPEGIVFATDRRITRVDKDGNIKKYQDNIDKIYKFSKVPIGASYWGLATVNSRTMLGHFKRFEETNVASKDDVNSISEKLKNYLESLKIEDSMGVHLAGYCRNDDELYPQLRHVFHTSWHLSGEFTNENSNQEYHLEDGTKRVYCYEPFIALFNGDNAIANAFFNFLPNIYPNWKGRIILDRLRLRDSIRLAKMVITTSGDILDFLYTIDNQKVAPVVRGLMVATITKEDGYQWIEKTQESCLTENVPL